jgi:hypothetical protein
MGKTRNSDRTAGKEIFWKAAAENRGIMID